jgi:surfeit locus 1 family protein
MPNRVIPAVDPATPRRRFRPRLVPTLAMLIAVPLFVAAGGWQRARMQAKEALYAQYDAVSGAAPVTLPEIGAGGDWAAQRYRPVIARGEFDAHRQIYVDNKVNAGRVGYHVVTPLKLADGRVVLVDRGWIAAGASRTALPAAPPPAGVATVEGRLNITDGYLELEADREIGPLRQNLDPARFAATTGLPVLPAIIEQTAPPVPDDGLVRTRLRPDFGVEKHRIYMLQWYAFAVLAVTLWALLNWRREAAGPGHE